MKAITLFKGLFLLVGMLCVGTFAFAGDGDKIIGTWMVPEKDAKVEIYKCGDKYCGKISWLEKENNDDGTARKDINNEDESLRDRTILGLNIMEGFEYNADDKEWVNGTIYNSRDGKTYSGYLMIQEDGTIYMKGYIFGMRWLGKSNIWTRVD